MNQPTLMIYGATRYTGQLVTAEALEAGLRPVLAGRNTVKLASVAGPAGLETRATVLEDAQPTCRGPERYFGCCALRGPLMAHGPADVQRLPQDQHALSGHYRRGRCLRGAGIRRGLHSTIRGRTMGLSEWPWSVPLRDSARRQKLFSRFIAHPVSRRHSLAAGEEAARVRAEYSQAAFETKILVLLGVAFAFHGLGRRTGLPRKICT